MPTISADSESTSATTRAREKPSARSAAISPRRWLTETVSSTVISSSAKRHGDSRQHGRDLPEVGEAALLDASEQLVVGRRAQIGTQPRESRRPSRRGSPSRRPGSGRPRRWRCRRTRLSSVSSGPPIAGSSLSSNGNSAMPATAQRRTAAALRGPRDARDAQRERRARRRAASASRRPLARSRPRVGAATSRPRSSVHGRARRRR